MRTWHSLIVALDDLPACVRYVAVFARWMAELADVTVTPLSSRPGFFRSLRSTGASRLSPVHAMR
jgi:hypothetical protein